MVPVPPDPHAKPSVAVIIPTRDRPGLVDGALESVRRFIRPQDEAVLVDSCSRDASAIAEVAARHDIRVVRADRPGASVARNAGLRATTAPLLAYTDDDCFVSEGWTAGIERAFSEERIGFVTGAIVGDRDVRVPLSVTAATEPLRFAGSVDPIACGSSANVAFRREALEEVGGFDELLGPGGRLGVSEDMDLFWRLLRAGWVGVFDPSIVVTHRQWRDAGKAMRQQFAYGLGAGAFAVKAIRISGSEGWALLRARLWRDGFKHSLSALRQGYESGAAVDAMRTVGVAFGAARAWWFPVSDGHYRLRRHPRRR